MLSVSNFIGKKVDYGDETMAQVESTIIAQQIAALADKDGVAQDLMIGASGKVSIMLAGENAIDIKAEDGRTKVVANHSQGIEIAPADADKTVILGSLTIKESTADHIQLISTALDVGIEINDDVKIQKSLIAANDLVVGGDVFTKSSFNLVRDFNEDANTMQVGYGFRIMDNSNLELYKYNSISNKTNTVAVFGQGQSTSMSGGNFPAFSTGFGAVQLQHNPAWRMDGSNISVSGSIVPEGDIIYDLGSADNRFRDLYLSGSTIHVGSTRLSTSQDGSLSVGGAKVASEDALIGLSNAVAQNKTDANAAIALKAAQTDFASLSNAVVANKTSADSNVSRIDARIDSVLSNADPVALNSLAEVVKAFQDADGNLNGAITNLASSAAGDVSSLTTTVAQNKTDAQSALDEAVASINATAAALASTVSSNKSGAESAIALKAAQADFVSLSNAVASNKSAADAAIALKAAQADFASLSNAVASNKSAADAAIALKGAASDVSSLQTMMLSLLQPGSSNTIVDGASADATTIAADGSKPSKDTTYNAWKFTNSTAGTKINWYLMSNPSSSDSTFLYSNFKTMYARIRLNSAVSKPFFATYTYRQNDGKDAASWFRSEKTCEVYSETPVVGNYICIYMGADPRTCGFNMAVDQAICLTRDATNANASNKRFATAPTYEFAGTENVWMCALSSDSGSSANNVNFTCFEFGYRFGSNMYRMFTKYA